MPNPLNTPTSDSVNVRIAEPPPPPATTWQQFFLKNGVPTVVAGFALWFIRELYIDTKDYVKTTVPIVIDQIHAGHEKLQAAAREDFKKELAARDRVTETILGFNKDSLILMQKQHDTSREVLSELKATRREARPAPK